MNNTEISEALFDSVLVLIDASLNKINYDRTLKYKIKDDTRKSEGIYRVTDGEIEFEAKVTDLNTEYRIDEEVYVTIIQGNFSNDKIIIGRYVENEENKPITYIAPEDLLISDYLIENNLPNIVGVTADKFWISNPTLAEEAETKKVCFFPFNSYNNGYIENDYTRLILGCEFINRLGDYNIIAGNYGVIAGIITSNKAISINSPELELPEVITGENTSLKEIQNYINNQEETDDLQFAIKYITLDSSDMIGNIYNYSLTLSQDIIVDISALKNIVGIYIELYLMNNFKSLGLTETVSLYQIYKNKYDIKDEDIPLTNEEHMFYAQEVNNIGILKVWIKFGYSQLDVEDNTLNLYTQSSLDFTPAGTKLEENQKNIKAKWIHKDNITGKLISINDLTSIEEYLNKYLVYWYTSSYETGDVYAGFGWTKIKDDDIGLIKTDDPLDLIYTPITDLSEISIKAVLLEKKENNWEAIALSSILTFKNKNIISNTSGVVYLEITDPQKEFNFYGQDFKIINYEDFNKVRTLKATIPETRTYENIRIEWQIPRGATMLLDPFLIGEEDLTNSKYKYYTGNGNILYLYGRDEYCIISKEYIVSETNAISDIWFSLSFAIKEFYNPTFIRNQITCRVYYDNQTDYYDEGKINLVFGLLGNNGTNYNFGLFFKNPDEPYITCTVNYDKSGKEIYEYNTIELVPYVSCNSYELTQDEINEALETIEYSWLYTYPDGYEPPFIIREDLITHECSVSLKTIEIAGETLSQEYNTIMSNCIKANIIIKGIVLESYLSLPIRRFLALSRTGDSDPRGILAPGIISYSSQGTNINYSTMPLKLYGNVDGKVTDNIKEFIGNAEENDYYALPDLQKEFLYYFGSTSKLPEDIDSHTFYKEDKENNSYLIKTSSSVENFKIGDKYQLQKTGTFSNSKISLVYCGDSLFYFYSFDNNPGSINFPYIFSTTWKVISHTDKTYPELTFSKYDDNPYGTSNKCIISNNANLSDKYYSQYNTSTMAETYSFKIEEQIKLPSSCSNLFRHKQNNRTKEGLYLYILSYNPNIHIDFSKSFYISDINGKFLKSIDSDFGRLTAVAMSNNIFKILLRDISTINEIKNTYINTFIREQKKTPEVLIKSIPFTYNKVGEYIGNSAVIIKDTNTNEYIRKEGENYYIYVRGNLTLGDLAKFYLFFPEYLYIESNYTTISAGTDIPITWSITKLVKRDSGGWQKLSTISENNKDKIGDPLVQFTENNNLETLWYLQPYPMYIDSNTGYLLEAYYTLKIDDNQSKNYLLWLQPLIIILNKYGEPILNQWNGQTNITDTHILSPAIGAGSKNEKNEFSGIFMGKVGTNVDDTNALHGLFGFSEGAEAFGFREDGTAFIGKSGAGRIEFDGNNSTIKSSGFDDNITYITEGENTYIEENSNIVNTNFPGMKLDLNEGLFLLRGETNSNPYFLISHKREDKSVVWPLAYEPNKKHYWLRSINGGSKLEDADFSIDLFNGKMHATNFAMTVGGNSDDINAYIKSSTFEDGSDNKGGEGLSLDFKSGRIDSRIKYKNNRKDSLGALVIRYEDVNGNLSLPISLEPSEKKYWIESLDLGQTMHIDLKEGKITGKKLHITAGSNPYILFTTESSKSPLKIYYLNPFSGINTAVKWPNTEIFWNAKLKVDNAEIGSIQCKNRTIKCESAMSTEALEEGRYVFIERLLNTIKVTKKVIQDGQEKDYEEYYHVYLVLTEQLLNEPTSRPTFLDLRPAFELGTGIEYYKELKKAGGGTPGDNGVYYVRPKLYKTIGKTNLPTNLVVDDTYYFLASLSGGKYMSIQKGELGSYIGYYFKPLDNWTISIHSRLGASLEVANIIDNNYYFYANWIESDWIYNQTSINPEITNASGTATAIISKIIGIDEIRNCLEIGTNPDTLGDMINATSTTTTKDEGLANILGFDKKKITDYFRVDSLGITHVSDLRIRKADGAEVSLYDYIKYVVGK